MLPIPEREKSAQIISFFPTIECRRGVGHRTQNFQKDHTSVEAKKVYEADPEN
jgi:hypothetical protein